MTSPRTALLAPIAAALALTLACAPADPWLPDEEASFDGTAPAALRAYSHVDCPRLDPGEVTGFPSGDEVWDLLVALPPEPVGAGVLMLHHGNGDRPEHFDLDVDAQAIADAHDVVVVMPRSNAGGRGFAWPVPPNDPTPGVRLFDDLLTCLVVNHGIDRTRVHVAGFSSGGLWASFLTMYRSTYLASAVLLSGGSDGVVPLSKTFIVNPYDTPAWPLPVLMAFGGDEDRAFLDFEAMTLNMAGQLAEDGSTTVLCDHGGGHRVPQDAAGWVWPFLDVHRLDGRVSPYADGADPSGALPPACVWD